MASQKAASPHLAVQEAASNNEPVEEDVKFAARAVIVAGEAVLRDIRNALATSSSYNALVSSLNETEAHILAEIEKCRSITSKTRVVPPEILEQIFLQCAALQPITIWQLPEPTPTTAFPWSLAAVCVKWRQIALSLGDIWTNIHAISFKYASGPEERSSSVFRNALGEPRMDQVLARSKGRPISLRLGWLHDWGYAEIPRILRATAPHLTTLDFVAAPNLQPGNSGPALLSFLDFLASEPEGLDFSQLTTISLQFGVTPMSLRFLRSANKLTTLNLRSTYRAHPLCLNALHDQIHLDKLTSLRISDRKLPGEVLYKILCHSPSLQDATVTARTFPIGIPGIISRNDLLPEFTLAHLSCLSIFVHAPRESVEATLWWLERLHLPRLVQLKLLPLAQRGQWNCPPLQLQVIQESKILQSLTLDMPMYMTDLLRLLEALPRLQHVELRNVCPATLVVRALAKGDLLPNLLTLKCGLYRHRLDEYLFMLYLRTRRAKEFEGSIVHLKRMDLVLYPPQHRYGERMTEDWDLSLNESPTKEDISSLEELGWSLNRNPKGWKGITQPFTSPHAVGLIALHRNI